MKSKKIREHYSNGLRANQDTVASFYRLLAALVFFGIPLMTLFGLGFEMGAIGVWIGKGFGVFLASGLLFLRVRRVLS